MVTEHVETETEAMNHGGVIHMDHWHSCVCVLLSFWHKLMCTTDSQLGHVQLSSRHSLESVSSGVIDTLPSNMALLTGQTVAEILAK